MALVTITGNTVRDSVGRKDNRPWYAWAADYQDGNPGVITPRRSKPLIPSNGVLSFEIEAGISAWIENPDGQRYLVTIPLVDGSLWEVIEAGVAYPPETSQLALDAAVVKYIEKHRAQFGLIAVPVPDSSPPMAQWVRVDNGEAVGDPVLWSQVIDEAVAQAAVEAEAPDAVAADLAGRDIDWEDAGGGASQMTVGGSPVGSPISHLPGNVWTGIAGDPFVNSNLAQALTATGSRSLAVKSKILGGNITVKPGHDWRHIWSEWDWDNWVKPQIDRAVKLGLRAVRFIGAPRAITDSTISYTAWAPSTAYDTGNVRVNGSRVYYCTIGGTSAGSGGPTGTGTGITDGTVTWRYLRENDLAPIAQATYDARWVQLVQYCATKGLDVYPCLCQVADFDSLGSGEFQNVGMTSSITTTAEKLAAFPNVIAFDIFQEGDVRTGTSWTASRSYGTGVYVNHGGNSYQATTGGVSAGSGGPTGTGSSITDGTVTWAYRGVPLLKADVLAMLTAIRSVCNVPTTMSFAPVFVDNNWHDYLNLWYLCYVDPDGPDFIDVHIYNGATLPRDVDFLATQTNKPIVVGEFGADQSQTSDDQVARYTAVVPIHRRDGVIGSFVWALADQAFSAVPSGQAGVWDNTGFVQGSAPLSLTSGVRTSLAGVLRRMAAAQPVQRPYSPPNILTPARARPPRNSTYPGGFAGFWSLHTNSAFVADPRGLGVKCVAGGSSSGLYIPESSGFPQRVTGNTWYRITFEVIADSVGREFNFFVTWHDESLTQLSRSPGASDTFQGADEVNMSEPFTVWVKSDPSATRAAPRIVWSSAQATDEIHILTSFEMTEA
ncbi:glycosyl hydrolase [Mycobacterium sp. TJFP1]